MPDHGEPSTDLWHGDRCADQKTGRAAGDSGYEDAQVHLESDQTGQDQERVH